MEYLVLIVLVAGFALVYFKKTEVKNENSPELLLQLNDALRKEIQEIRKEVGDNAEKGEKKLKQNCKEHLRSKIN